jgi:hypothetical protein
VAQHSTKSPVVKNTPTLDLSSWKSFQLDELFDLKKGKRLTKADMKAGNTLFIGSTDSNNGVTAKVGQDAIHSGNTITVAYNGSVAESFYQPFPFWATDDVNVLYPKFKMTAAIGLFICAILRQEKYRYNYGRKWHLDRMRVTSIKLPATQNGAPDWDFIESYIQSLPCRANDDARKPANEKTPSPIMAKNWKPFELQALFDIERGRGPRRKNLNGSGSTPFITSIDSNNGFTMYTTVEPSHKGNTIGVNRNGSVGEAFYQPVPFCSTEDVHIFTPKKEWESKMNPAIGLFLTTLIRQEKYRFNYGRKWGIERMKISVIKLPVDSHGSPDFSYMENYIKSLPYSSVI